MKRPRRRWRRHVLGVLLAACPSAGMPGAVLADSPAVRFRPVGRSAATQEAAPQELATKQRPGWNLRWRESSLVQESAAGSLEGAEPVIRPAAFQEGRSAADDPFADPFGDRMSRPAAQQDEGPAQPGDAFQLPPAEAGPSAPESVAPPVAIPQEETGEGPLSPSDRDGQRRDPAPSPFERDRDVTELAPPTSDQPEAEEMREDRLMPLTPMQPGPEPVDRLDCERLREVVRNRTIDKISLDISPPFRPDVLEEEPYERLLSEFLRDQPERQWRDVEGNLLAVGALQDLAYEAAVIQVDSTTETLPMDLLSEADLQYIAEAWGLPRECRLDRPTYTGRNWMPVEMTWKASGLCHKPLYFEEVQLERYGHTAGPFVQPVVSSAHFFANIAVMPYKMGIHPPGECQYALGYYRPGNCAPWLLPPVPLSLRGALSQTAAVAGGILLIP